MNRKPLIVGIVSACLIALIALVLLTSAKRGVLVPRSSPEGSGLPRSPGQLMAPSDRPSESSNRTVAASAIPPQPDAPAEGPVDEPWKVLLGKQRDMVQGLRGKTCSQANWTSEPTFEAQLHQLEKGIGIRITWDPSLPGDFATTPIPMAITADVVAWDVLNFASDLKGAPVLPTEDGVRYVARSSLRDPARIEHFEQDPYGALASARLLIAEDCAFHRQWASIQDCEGAQISMGVGVPIRTWWDLRDAMGTSLGLSFFWFTDLNPRAALPSTEGLKRGTALEVLRSWNKGQGAVTIVTGRRGLEVWTDVAAAQARAADKAEYEKFRSLLAGTQWTSGGGEYALADVIAELRKTIDIKVVLDPYAAGLRMPVEGTDSYLAILERLVGRDREFGWTWVSGWIVLTRETPPPDLSATSQGPR